MSDRFCPSCRRMLPWEWNGVVAPTCYQVPDDYGRGCIDHFKSCRLHDEEEAEFESAERRRADHLKEGGR